MLRCVTTYRVADLFDSLLKNKNEVKARYTVKVLFSVLQSYARCPMYSDDQNDDKYTYN